MKKLVIIPAYNEAESIIDVLTELMPHTDFDVAVINDCSTDSTARLVRQFRRKHKNVHLIDLPYNLGIGGAVQTGYRYAWHGDYDIAVQMDGDGQHNSEFLRALTEPLENGTADMVIGSRFMTMEGGGFQSTATRRIGIAFFRRLAKLLTGQEIRDMTSGFRAVNRKVIVEFTRDYPVDYPEPETNVRLLHRGYKVQEIPVLMRERQGGVSSISYTGAVWYMIKVTLAILIDYWRLGERSKTDVKR